MTSKKAVRELINKLDSTLETLAVPVAKLNPEQPQAQCIMLMCEVLIGLLDTVDALERHAFEQLNRAQGLEREVCAQLVLDCGIVDDLELRRISNLIRERGAVGAQSNARGEARDHE